MVRMKGQGASEYLIILAVVLIVALVAIALLGAFPAFGGDAKAAEARQYWQTVRPFSIVEWNQQGAVLAVSLKNTEADRILLSTINATGVGTSGANSSGIVFNGGASKVITIGGLRTCDSVGYDYYEYNISYTYNTSYITGVRVVGNKPLIGPCVP